MTAGPCSDLFENGSLLNTRFRKAGIEAAGASEVDRTGDSVELTIKVDRLQSAFVFYASQAQASELTGRRNATSRRRVGGLLDGGRNQNDGVRG